MAVYRVGEAGVPPLGTLDPELLRFAEGAGYSLLSLDRRTMPTHVAHHLATGGHTWGVFLIRRQATWQRLIDDLLLIWSASEAEEWRDRIERLPW
jgi:hypothetical protein